MGTPPAGLSQQKGEGVSLRFQGRMDKESQKSRGEKEWTCTSMSRKETRQRREEPGKRKSPEEERKTFSRTRDWGKRHPHGEGGEVSRGRI